MPTAPIYALETNIEFIAEIFFGLSAFFSITYCLWRAKLEASLVPIYLLLGSALCTLYEPYADVLGLAIYPEIDIHVLFDLVGRKVPIYVGFIYLFYFPVAFVYLREQFIKGYSPQHYTRFCAITIGSACVFEILPVHFGLWHYYGTYVDKVYGFPLIWGFLNGQSVICSAVILHLISQRLQTQQQFIIIACAPLVFFGVHFSAAMPLYTVLNSTTATVPTTLATLLSAFICVVFCWAGSHLVCKKT